VHENLIKIWTKKSSSLKLFRQSLETYDNQRTQPYLTEIIDHLRFLIIKTLRLERGEIFIGFEPRMAQTPLLKSSPTIKHFVGVKLRRALIDSIQAYILPWTAVMDIH
jgi:hypothetical protein